MRRSTGSKSSQPFKHVKKRSKAAAVRGVTFISLLAGAGVVVGYLQLGR